MSHKTILAAVLGDKWVVNYDCLTRPVSEFDSYGILLVSDSYGIIGIIDHIHVISINRSCLIYSTCDPFGFFNNISSFDLFDPGFCLYDFIGPVNRNTVGPP